MGALDLQPRAEFVAQMVDQRGARAALWFFGDSDGRDPGTFVSSLLAAMAAADETNRARLVAAFPEWGFAFLIGKSARDGIQQLRAIAASPEGVAA